MGRSPRSRQGPVLAQDQPRGEPQEQTGPVLVQDQQGGGAGEGAGPGLGAERSGRSQASLLCAGRSLQTWVHRSFRPPRGSARREAAAARTGTWSRRADRHREDRGSESETRRDAGPGWADAGFAGPARARGSGGGGKQRDRGRRLAGRLVRVPGRDVLPSTSAIGSLAQAAPLTRLRSHRSHPAGLPSATAPAPRRLRRSAMRSAVGSSHAHSRALTGRPKGNAGAGHAQRTRGQASPDGTVTTGMCCWPGGDRGRQARDRSELRKCDQGRSPARETRGDV